MIRLVVYDLEAAVDLLQEHYPEYLVGEGGLAEAEPEVCPLKHLVRQAQRAADNEGYFAAAGIHYALKPRRHFSGCELFPLQVHGDEIVPEGNLCEYPLPLRTLHLLHLGGRKLLRRPFV